MGGRVKETDSRPTGVGWGEVVVAERLISRVTEETESGSVMCMCVCVCVGGGGGGDICIICACLRV